MTRRWLDGNAAEMEQRERRIFELGWVLRNRANNRNGSEERRAGLPKRSERKAGTARRIQRRSIDVDCVDGGLERTAPIGWFVDIKMKRRER